jgi:hypothetical protein
LRIAAESHTDNRGQKAEKDPKRERDPETGFRKAGPVFGQDRAQTEDNEF